MSTDAPAPAAPADPAAARADKRLVRLDEMAELGMELARQLVREQAARAAAAEAGGTPAPSRIDPGLAFSRITRAVRLTLALEARFDAGLPMAEPLARGAAGSEDAPPDRVDEAAPEKTPHQRAEHRRETIATYVSDALGREYDGAEWEELTEDVTEVLDAFDDEVILNRSIGEVVEEICRAFGVPFDFTLYDWRTLEVPRERCRTRPLPEGLAALIQAPP